MCLAKNDMGNTNRTVELRQADKPRSPAVRAKKVTPSTVNLVVKVAGIHNGPQPTKILWKYVEPSNNRKITNEIDTSPGKKTIYITKLTPMSKYTFQVQVESEVGLSDPTQVVVDTPEKMRSPLNFMSVKIKGSETQPLCKIGIISDVQYADIEDRYNYSETRRRYYRNSLHLLRRAVTKWCEEEVSCVLQLGDIIDGLNKQEAASEKALSTVLDVFKQYTGPVYHTLGNHELYNFNKKQLQKTDLFCGSREQCMCPPDVFYYSVNLNKGVKIIVLNCYDVTALGLDKDSDDYTDMVAFLRKTNPNPSLNSSWGLIGADKRFVQFNGGISPEQLEWFEDNLKDALNNRQNVIVMGHIATNERCSGYNTLIWNYKDVMDVLQKYSACVICYLAGHDHSGGSHLDDHGIQHITFPAVVECNEKDAYATAYLYEDRLVIHGEGSVDSFDIKLRFPCNSM